MTPVLPEETAGSPALYERRSSPVDKPERILADIGGPKGPLLIVTYQIHGNEPAGREACDRVIEHFAKHGAPALKGRMVMICGNLAATAAAKRQIDRDLNRVFTDASPAGTADESLVESAPHEYIERDQLIDLIGRLKAEHEDEPLWFLDLHTTSSESIPYLSLPSDDLGLLTYAKGFPLHFVTGFSETVKGTIDSYLFDQGFVGFACEGGQHDRQSSASNMEALILLVMAETAILPLQSDGERLPEIIEAQTLLEKFILHQASHFRIIHRHAIKPGDGFVMEPGFSNFSPVRAGMQLALDSTGPILSSHDAHVLMPLYQPTGSDGFFIVEEQQSDS